MSQSPLPHLWLSLTPSPIVFPSPSSHKTALYQGSQKPHFCQTQWSLSDTADCFLHQETLYLWAPTTSLSWLCSQAFLPSYPTSLQTSEATGLAGALCSLLRTHSLLGRTCSFKSQPRPQISLQPQPSPEHQLRVSTGLFVISTCSSNRPVQKRTLNFYPPNYISLSLDSSLSHPTPKPSTHRVSSTP